MVSAGDLIARLSSTRAEADLAGAQEELVRAQRQYDNAQELQERGVGTIDRVSEARAVLAAATSQVTQAEEALENLTIVAPFDGRIETLTLDSGEFISAGEEVGRIVDNRPLTVAIQVPQQALNRIKDGQTANVRFITGEQREGVVTFVGTSAAASTRTFLAEIEVPNDDRAIPAGISAEIEIPTAEAQAHFIEASIVSLNPQGEIGVKTVEDGIVRFHPIEVVKAELAGVWVKGLPDTARIITIGQGFVRAGEEVNPPDRRAGRDRNFRQHDRAVGMNTLIDAAFSRTRAMVVTLAIILVIGAIAYVSIPKEANPEVPLPLVYVSTGIDGISPTDAERLLLEPMEAEFGAIQGLETMSSEAAEGFCQRAARIHGRRRYR